MDRKGGSGKRIGYIRVSSPDQCPDRQLQGVDLDKKFIEYCTAKSLDRPELLRMMDYAREDDIIFVHSMDRLARNLIDLRQAVDTMVAQGISVEFVKEKIRFSKDGTTPLDMLMLHLLGAFAEFERAFILERQREGIEIAKAAGKYGRGIKIDDESLDMIKNDLLNSRKTRAQIAREHGLSRATLYNYLKFMGIER